MRIEPGRARTEQEVQEIQRLWIESDGGRKSVEYRYHRVWFESAAKITVVVDGAYVVELSFTDKGPHPTINPPVNRASNDGCKGRCYIIISNLLLKDDGLTT